MNGDAISVAFSSRIDETADEWDELCDAVEAPPWLRPQWFRLWHHAFGRNPLEIITARSGARLTGVWVFERTGRELRSAANYETPDHGPVVADEGSMAAMVEALLDLRPPRLNLFPLVNDATSRALRITAIEAGYLLLEQDLGGSPFVRMGTWDEYRGQLDSKMLREIRRRKRRLEERGPLELVVHTNLDYAENVLEESFALEEKGWKGKAGTAIASRPETRRFYSDLARTASDSGELVLAQLKSNGTTIAFDLAVERNGVHYLVKTAFDESLAKLGPGVQLRYKMLERAFSIGLTRYEFLGANEPWKQSWAFEIRPLLHLRAFRSTLEGKAFGWLRTIKRSISRAQ